MSEESPTYSPGEKSEPQVDPNQSNGGELRAAPAAMIPIDTSHKYTDVHSTDYIGPGNAHHEYAITRKEDGELFLKVKFQDGPIKEAGVNGVMDENLIAIVIDRLEGFQSGPYACQENQDALDHLETALGYLQARTAKREARGVEGTHTI